MHPSLQVAVFGAGSFGQNHIRVYRQFEQQGAPVHLAAVIDPALADSAHPCHSLSASTRPPRLFTTPDACLAAHRSGQLRLDAASICTPTAAHHPVASAALSHGIGVLIEKPIATTLAQAGDLIALARQAGLTLQVGHLERFNPAVQAFLPHLNRPMFFEAHRMSVFTPRSLDVDVVLDLMIHDLDIVLTFAQSPVREIRAVGLPILSPRTDIANVRVEFDSGCVANFTASRVSTERIRKLRFFQPRQYVSIDYARQEILLIETSADAMKEGTPHPSPGLNILKPEITPGEPLRLEIESFLDAVREKTKPVVSGEDARAALALALDINAAIATHIQRTGL